MRTPDPDFSSNHVINPLLHPKKRSHKNPQNSCFSFPSQSIPFFSIDYEPFKSILFWLSLSLLIGPFAPPSLTGGDIRVGVGPIIPDPIDQEPQPEPEYKKKSSHRRSKADKVDEPSGNRASLAEDANGFPNLKVKSKDSIGLSKKEDLGNNSDGGEKEWSEADMEMLKKQMAKNPVGKHGRWEIIAAAFNWKHKMESVIKKTKELGEKKVDDADSYVKFLKNRKPLIRESTMKAMGIKTVAVVEQLYGIHWKTLLCLML